MSFAPLKFGVFFPIQDSESSTPDQLPERNRSLISMVDGLGYDCVWLSNLATAGTQQTSSLEASLASLAKSTSARDIGLCCPASSYQLQAASSTFQTAIACQYTPEGARTAGIHGAKLITTDATTPGGFNALGPCWEVYGRYASKNNQVVDRANWSLVGPVHIANNRKEAFRNVNFGLENWITIWSDHTGASIVPEGKKNTAAYLVENGLAVIGTPTDAINQIKRLQIQSGGFGTFLQLAHSWADPENTEKSYRLFAEKVMPRFSLKKTRLD